MSLDRRQSSQGPIALAARVVMLSAMAAVFCRLMPAADAAQQAPTGSAAGAIPGAGEAAIPPDIDLSERKQLLIVGSTTMEPLADAVIQRLIGKYVMPEPIKRFKGTERGIDDFCAGVGPQFPDIAAASYRMDRAQYDRCVENHVLDVIEVAIGQSAVVVVTKNGNPVFDITPRMVYYAAAENIPIKGDFAANPNKTWRDTDKAAPDLPIRILIPSRGSGTRGFFDDYFMQGGCRHVKEIDAIFAAADRVPRCITPRDDGPVVALEEPFAGKALAAMSTAPPGTIAVVTWSHFIDNRDKLAALPVDGVPPTHESIADYSYPMATTQFYYFKRAHMRNSAGRGVVRGIREFMAEIVGDDASGEGGYLEKLGLIALTPRDRRKQAENVRRLKRYEP